MKSICKICHVPTEKNILDLCPRCKTMSKLVDDFIDDNFELATNFLLKKLNSITSHRLQEQDKLYLESLQLPPLPPFKIITEGPANLHVIVTTAISHNRKTERNRVHSRHIKVLENLEINRLQRHSGSLLCKEFHRYYELLDSDEENKEATCKRCLQIANSLEKKSINIIYLNKKQAQSFMKKLNSDMNNF